MFTLVCGVQGVGENGLHDVMLNGCVTLTDISWYLPVRSDHYHHKSLDAALAG